MHGLFINLTLTHVADAVSAPSIRDLPTWRTFYLRPFSDLGGRVVQSPLGQARSVRQLMSRSNFNC